MKKVIIFLYIFCSIFALTACGETSAVPTDTSADTSNTLESTVYPPASIPDISMTEIESTEQMEKEVQLKENTLHKIIERAFLIWLYPNHHLKPSEVKEILKPWADANQEAILYFLDNGKCQYL